LDQHPPVCKARVWKMNATTVNTSTPGMQTRGRVIVLLRCKVCDAAFVNTTAVAHVFIPFECIRDLGHLMDLSCAEGSHHLLQPLRQLEPPSMHLWGSGKARSRNLELLHGGEREAHPLLGIGGRHTFRASSLFPEKIHASTQVTPRLLARKARSNGRPSLQREAVSHLRSTSVTEQNYFLSHGNVRANEYGGGADNGERRDVSEGLHQIQKTALINGKNARFSNSAVDDVILISSTGCALLAFFLPQLAAVKVLCFTGHRQSSAVSDGLCSCVLRT
jgi:hypothetical protein